jgi:hypothetical protein
MSQREEDETIRDQNRRERQADLQRMFNTAGLPPVIEPDGSPVDYSSIQEAMQDDTAESTTALVPAGSKEIVDPRPLNKIYHDTIGYKIRCSFADGEGIIYTMIAGWVGLAIATAITFWIWLAEVVAVIAANADVIVSILMTLLAVLLPLFLGLARGKSGTVVVKGCPKGPTPGAVRISRH